jgi:lysophospholipase L1-like esterase
VVYEETLPPASAPAWGFPAPGADAVVLSAGGNDVDFQGMFPDPNAFVTTFVAWLGTLRAHHPSAALFVVLSQSSRLGDNGVLGAALQQIVATVRAGGDNNVFYYNYFTGDPLYHTYDDLARGENVYWGCGYHPSPAGARMLAHRLATFIASKKGWAPPP